MFFITYELRSSAPRLWTYPLVTRYVVPNLLVLVCGYAAGLYYIRLIS